MAMEMKMNLNLKMSQKLVMTPMLQQAIKLLPLARLELDQLVRQEIIDNPVLEEILEEEIDSFDEKITTMKILFLRPHKTLRNRKLTGTIIFKTM